MDADDNDNGPTKFSPTEEQDADLRSKGHSVKINAFAGSGKTSTRQLLVNATGLRGQYPP